jgi:thiamine-phosphate diphosphorylase
VRLTRSSVPKLYALTDREAAGLSHPDIVAELVAAGVQWIQIREKALSDAEFFAQTERALMSLPATVRAFVNDRADIALALCADGVHSGAGDLSPASIRKIPGSEELLVGFSTHDVESAVSAAADADVDYVAIGPIFRSQTKNVRDAVGIEAIAAIRRRTDKPLIAIGGIDETNIRSVLDAGADSAAVIAALYRGRAVRANAERLLAAAGGSR